MITKKHLLFVLSGAAAWEFLGHLLLSFTNKFPINIWGINLTSGLNSIILVVSSILAVTFFYLAQKSQE